MKPRHMATLTLLGAIWGASFIFIHMAVESFGPLALMWGRVTLAGLTLGIIGYSTGNLPDFRRYWRAFLIVGTVNAALPFTLIAWSELVLSASQASIINSTTPLFTAIIAAIWIGETLSARKIIGVFAGIVGVAILVGGSAMVISSDLILAALASLVAAASYGVGTVYASRSFVGLKPLQTAIGQLCGASAALLIPALFTLPTEVPPMDAIFAMLALSLLSTAVAYLLYFYLLANVGPTRTASVTFLVPVFGTLWGVSFLGDRFTSSMLVGMVVVLAAVGLVIGGRLRQTKPLQQTEPAVRPAAGD